MPAQTARTQLDLAQFDGHTPGPWAPMRDSDNLFGIVAYNDGDSFEVARTYDEHGHADTALLAAAPELLSECRALRAENARLREALADVELRCTQDRMASTIGKKKDRTDFLRGALDRISAAARAALKVSE